MKSIVFDTETTGLLLPNANDVSEQPYIIEFAGIVFEDDGKKFAEIDRYTCLINVPVILSPKINQITGITQNDIDGKAHFISHYLKLYELFLGCRNVIAHNLPFDRSMLANELIRIDKLIQFPWPPVHICTVESSMYVEGYRLSLDKLYKKATGKDRTASHRAMVDVENLLECYKWLRKKNKISL